MILGMEMLCEVVELMMSVMVVRVWVMGNLIFNIVGESFGVGFIVYELGFEFEDML